MFETSSSLFFQSLLYNILLPIIPGIFFLRLFFGKKIKGLLLYILGRFLGVGVVAFSLFNLQFIHFGIGIGEYFGILGLIIILFMGKFIYRKENLSDYISTLKIKNPIKQIKQSFVSLSKTEKIFTIVSSIFTIIFLIVSFIHVNKFPTYADDSFGNWHKPVMNIIQDGGVKLFGSEDEILARGRLGYPIYIPIYKALVSDFMGGFNDIYINMRQWLVLFGLLLFSTYFTRNRTKNIFYTVLPSALICSLPLVYFHAVEGYMDLACAAYSVLTIGLFYMFLEKKDYSFALLGFLLGFILSHLKYDGLVGYFAGIVISLNVILFINNQFKETLQGFRKQKNIMFSGLFFFFFFFLPFITIRLVNKLGLNPAEIDKGGIGLSQTVHREIFSQFKGIFLQMDNYNIMLPIIILIIYYLYDQKKDFNKYFLFLSGCLISIIFTLVFLLTENYKRVMDQTTVNRVFTMSFVILLSFTGILFHKKINE